MGQLQTVSASVSPVRDPDTVIDGYITEGVDQDFESDSLTLENPQGNTIAIDTYNRREKINFTGVIMVSSATIPEENEVIDVLIGDADVAPGTALTRKYIVGNKVSIKLGSGKEWRKINFEATRYIDSNFPAQV